MAIGRSVALITVTCLGIASFGAVPANATLVGYYTFSNTANLGLDSSGNGNNLTVYGGSNVGYSGGGPNGASALTLNGNGYLSTANGLTPANFPSGNGAYTMSVSFRTSATQALNGIPLTLMGWGAYSTGGSTPNTSNALRLLLAGAEGGQGVNNYWWYNDLQAHAIVEDNQWHTLVASYDGTTRSIYLDGTLLASDTPGPNNATDANFAIGKADPLSVTNDSFIGSLADVAIFTTALTPTQVSTALSDVPEPASLGIFAAGVIGLSAARRKKRG